MKIQKITWNLALSLCAAAAVTACGGGGGDTTANSPASYNIAAASNNTATSVGVVAITADSSDTAALTGADSVVDMTAAVGDSWRLVYNSSTKAFKLRAVSSSYGLSGYSDQGTLTKTVSGTIETYSGAFGTSNTANSGSVSIKLDTRTKSVVGSVTWRDGSNTAVTSDVTGTTLAPNSTAVAGLAGNYVFANQARNHSGAPYPSSSAGTLNIDSSGRVSICPGKRYTGGVCNKVDGTTPTDGTETPYTLQLTATAGQPLTLSAVGTKTLTFPSGNTGVRAHVQAGDLGPVLVVDQDWMADDGVTRRTGIFLAARISTIDASKFPGSFYCPGVTINGVSGATATATATSATVTNAGGSATATVSLNKVYDIGAGVERDFPGVFYIEGSSNGVLTRQHGFSLSSSLFVYQNASAERLNFCQRI